MITEEQQEMGLSEKAARAITASAMRTTAKVSQKSFTIIRATTVSGGIALIAAHLDQKFGPKHRSEFLLLVDKHRENISFVFSSPPVDAFMHRHKIIIVIS